jgi:hypothetical protein
MHKSSFAWENVFIYIMVPYLSEVSGVTHKICWVLRIFIYFIKSWSFVLFFQRVRITTQSTILVSTVFALVLFILSFLKELIVNYVSPFLSKRRKTKISIIEFLILVLWNYIVQRFYVLLLNKVLIIIYIILIIINSLIVLLILKFFKILYIYLWLIIFLSLLFISFFNIINLLFFIWYIILVSLISFHLIIFLNRWKILLVST